MCSNFSHLFLTVQVVCVAKNLTLFEFIARRNKHTTLYVMYVHTYLCSNMYGGERRRPVSGHKQAQAGRPSLAEKCKNACARIHGRCTALQLQLQKRARMHTVVQKCISRQSCKFGPNQAGLNLPKLGQTDSSPLVNFSSPSFLYQTLGSHKGHTLGKPGVYAMMQHTMPPSNDSGFHEMGKSIMPFRTLT